VFEKGDIGQNEFKRIAIREGFDPLLKSKINPATGHWFEPFQAADLMAWEFRRVINDVVYNQLYQFRA